MTAEIPTYKIIVIGASGVGKTTFLMRFVNEHAVSDEPKVTFGLQHHAKQLSVDGRVAKLSLWDSAVYDVNSYTSFLKLKDWLRDLELHSTNTDTVSFIVGNKIDLDQREVSRREGLRFATRHDCLFTETSAKTNECVRETFEDLVHEIFVRQRKNDEPEGVVVLEDSSQVNSNSYWCKCRYF